MPCLFNPLRLLSFFCVCFFSSLSFANTINVFDALSLQRAMKTAQPGDTIILNPGFYEGDLSTSGHNNAHFYSNQSGTPAQPITLKSYDKNDQQTLLGTTFALYYGVYITGDHWVIRDLVVQHAQKGIVLDHANYTLMDNIKVFDIGEEAVHIRDSSQNNVLSNCLITDTGKAGRPGYGEGVYIGSDTKLIPNDFSNNNRVGGCQIGPRVTGELFDVKENTTKTIIEKNYLIGDAIAGIDYHYADSLIDIKGDRAIVRYNTMDDKGNINVTHGVHALKKKTHVKSFYYGNTVTLNAQASFVKIGEGTAYVLNNTLVNANRVVQDYSRGDWNTAVPEYIKSARTYTGYNGGQATVEPAAPISVNYSDTKNENSSTVECLDYQLGDRIELDLTKNTCLTMNTSLENKNVFVWDSDVNSACDYRGSVSDGNAEANISSNYQQLPAIFTGNQLHFLDERCAYIKVRIQPM